MVYFTDLCGIVVQFTCYNRKIPIIKRVFFRLFLIYCRYFDCLAFIQNLPGFFQDCFFFDIPVFSMDDAIGIVFVLFSAFRSFSSLFFAAISASDSDQ